MSTEKMPLWFYELTSVAGMLDRTAAAENKERADLLRDAVREYLERRNPGIIVPPFPVSRRGRPRKVAQ
jgi:hypothetical protein